MELHIWACSMELTLHLDLGCGNYFAPKLRAWNFHYMCDCSTELSLIWTEQCGTYITSRLRLWKLLRT